MASAASTILVATDADAPAIAFLLGREGSRRRHSGGLLIDHLVGVRNQLRSWDCAEYVCRAGLFHSVYGTESYRHQTVSEIERPRIREIIGEEAEGLVQSFCRLRTREYLAGLRIAEIGEAPVRLETRDADLLHLIVANWLEQFPRLRPLHRAAHMNAFKRLQGHLRPQAQRDLEAVYDFGGSRIVPIGQTCPLGVNHNTGRPLELLIMDEVVTPHLALRLTALTQRNIWRFGWRAATTQTSHHFWHSHFGGDTEDGKADCEHELANRPLMAPVLELWDLVRERFAPGHVLVRAYANGHTFGADGHLHTDSEQPGHFTTIYYAHDIWEANWAGETVFFNETGDDVLHAVHPKPGRLVHFPGTVPHAARGPSRDCPALRAVIVLKSYAPDLTSGIR